MTLDDRGITVLNNGKETDITPKELQKVAEFKEAGYARAFYFGITTMLL